MGWEWNAKELRETAWATTFKRGLNAWLALVAVCFLFAFVGVHNSSQTSFVDTIDSALGMSDDLTPGNVDILIDYAETIPAVRDFATRLPKTSKAFVDSISRSSSWVIRLLALNPAYLRRNPREALVNIVLVALVSILLRFVVQNVMVVGLNRYVMETRFSRDVAMSRLLAPFHLHTLLNVIWVMVCYHVTLMLWWLTIVGGVYKHYQYRMVPFLLAEDPTLSWQEARQLSTRMTDGYKWKMFTCKLGWWYLYLLAPVIVVGLVLVTPLDVELDAELYFKLRANPQVGHHSFKEPAFDGAPCALLAPDEQEALPAPSYLLEDLDIRQPERLSGPLAYPVVEIVYLFFTFCFVGWVWEVGLHFLQAHEFVNRGTLYGPWIPIYGFGGVGIVVGLDRFKDRPERLFTIAMVLCAVLEYATSFALDFMFNSSYWDYKDMLLNVNGRICLAGLLAFGIGGMAGTYVVAPLISTHVRRMPNRLKYGVAGALLAAFLADVGYCAVHGFNSGSGVGENL